MDFLARLAKQEGSAEEWKRSLGCNSRHSNSRHSEDDVEEGDGDYEGDDEYKDDDEDRFWCV